MRDKAPRAPLPRVVRGVLLAIALVFLVFTKDRADSWADGSRLGTIQALVEHGTLALDDTDFLWQGDRVRLGEHFYSHQPPMLALLGAAPYAVLHHGFGRAIDDPYTYRILTWVLVGLPLWLGYVALARLLVRTGASAGWCAALLALAAFGTIALPYSLVLQQHGTAAGLVLLAFGAVQRRRAGLAGVLLALATTIDLTAVFAAVAVAWPVLKTRGARGVLAYGLAALPVLALHFGVNWSLTGDLVPVGLHLEAFEYPYSPFMLMALTGGEQRAGEGLAYLWGALFGGSGYLSHHPVVVPAILTGLALLAKRGRSAASPLAPGLLAAAAATALGIAAYYLTQSRNFGGSAFGMRWFAVFSPLLALFPAVWLARRERPLALPSRVAVGALALWSVGAAALGSVQPWAKFRYFFHQRPDALIAAPGETPPDWTTHLRWEWGRVTSFRQRFDVDSYMLWFQDHLHRAGKLYTTRWEAFDEEQQQEWHRTGLEKLQPIVDLLVRANDLSGCRVVGHYWLGKLHHLLGDRAAAGREYDKALALNASYGPAHKGRLKLAREEGAPQRRGDE